MDLQPSNNQGNENNSFSFRERHAHRHDVIERMILAGGSFIVITLAIRFTLALFGANLANGFASMVFNFTNPLVVPFTSLFSYSNPSLGASSFEGYTLVSMGIYVLITADLTRLVSITRY